MSDKIDRSKCGKEYSLCKQCQYEDALFYTDKCQSCTQLVDVGYDFLLCGIAVGSGLTHLHRNFIPKMKGGADDAAD